MAAMQSVELSRNALAMIALVTGGWLAVAVVLSLAAVRRWRSARALVSSSLRDRALLAASPALSLLVHADLRTEGSERLARLLGLDSIPDTLEGFMRGGSGLSPEDMESLQLRIAEVRRSGGAFTHHIRPQGSTRVLAVRGGPAPPPWRLGATLLWMNDDSEQVAAAAALRQETGRASAALHALSGLIEAAPFPMWHRGPDLSLTMVNGAYVAAVEAGSAADVVAAGVELVEETVGAVELARKVRDERAPIARNVPATIAGERRMIRIVEVPLGSGGVAGYAIDVEDREQARGDLARFVRAQRDMLDRLSAGVAMFGANHNLAFFNQPFARMFSLSTDFLVDRPEFDRLIEAMREGRNLPEVRDFPTWKEERRSWFNTGGAEEEDWLLPGGTHLRVVAQPLPDGGLVLIFEDRTEQLRLASARDTLLRVRTATFDNLFEAVGVFASDGRLNLWNTRFSKIWDFEEKLLAGHPRIDVLVSHIAGRLKNARHAGLLRELVRTATSERKQRSGRVSLADGRDFEFAAVPLPDGNALFTMLDVTDSRKIEAALRERNQALEEADRLKTAFMSNISYELRTPLTSIAGFAEMLDSGYGGALEPAGADYVKAILGAVERLGALIDDVLDLTQGDERGFALTQEDVDLASMCEAAAEAVEAEAKERSVSVALDIGTSLGVVAGDRRRLLQVMLHLLRNGVGQASKGGIVTLGGRGSETEALLTVAHDGAGIVIEEQGRRFTRAAGAHASALGLGLPLARQFIEAHGGTLTLASEPAKGTVITIRLPRMRP